MTLLFKLVENIFGYRFVKNHYIALHGIYISERIIFVAEKFIRLLVEKYGKHSVYIEDGVCYP